MTKIIVFTILYFFDSTYANKNQKHGKYQGQNGKEPLPDAGQNRNEKREIQKKIKNEQNRDHDRRRISFSIDLFHFRPPFHPFPVSDTKIRQHPLSYFLVETEGIEPPTLRM